MSNEQGEMGKTSRFTSVFILGRQNTRKSSLKEYLICTWMSLSWKSLICCAVYCGSSCRKYYIHQWTPENTTHNFKLCSF